ncbi:hypothetical protein PAXRUDRAFT_20316 [Paxillus rubicundulus Ve08.2h10]|uniref:Uncharacterized protein n=1 Tax=Paxillus rubicundulus Ve08.2h10 TaxID=930991 RepID=A0A0D0D2A2_9AGAM|nr:hypothetical protein PAXRUDRAFT_20316 [Paxillus rubicundulus Ve08.2h10]
MATLGILVRDRLERDLRKSLFETIKNKYDPHKLFVVAQGVGADDWNPELQRFSEDAEDNSEQAFSISLTIYLKVKTTL